MDPRGIRINEKRFWSTLMRSSEIGPGTAGGLRRLALSDTDREMRDQFVSWCKDAGCAVTIDQAGNIFARLEGREKLPPVAMGSHLDTTAFGGRFDGILGVLSGLEVIRTLQDKGFKPKRPIEVINWSNEEGVRFPVYMSGSLVFSGQRPIEWLYSLTDGNGLTFGDELRRIGYAGDVPAGSKYFDTYFELHIEQGPILYEADIPVGIVVGGAFVRGLSVSFQGQTAHSGGTPMNRRANALVGAAKFITTINDIGWKFTPMGRTTATWIKVWPNKRAAIPGYVEVMVDMRHQDPTETNQMYQEVIKAVNQCAWEARLDFKIHEEWTFGGNLHFDLDCIACLRNSAKVLNVPAMDLYSQAGHDAYFISQVAPTAMIFCPCVDGLSHNEAENIIPEQTWPSVNVLLQAVLTRAER